MSWKEDANGYTWELRGNEITCDNLSVCELEVIHGPLSDYWQIKGDARFKFVSARAAFFFVMDRCI